MHSMAEPDRVGTAEPAACIDRNVGAAFAHPTRKTPETLIDPSPSMAGRRAVARHTEAARLRAGPGQPVLVRVQVPPGGGSIRVRVLPEQV